MGRFIFVLCTLQPIGRARPSHAADELPRWSSPSSSSSSTSSSDPARSVRMVSFYICCFSGNAAVLVRFDATQPRHLMRTVRFPCWCMVSRQHQEIGMSHVGCTQEFNLSRYGSVERVTKDVAIPVDTSQRLVSNKGLRASQVQCTYGHRFGTWESGYSTMRHVGHGMHCVGMAWDI